MEGGGRKEKERGTKGERAGLGASCREIGEAGRQARKQGKRGREEDNIEGSLDVVHIRNPR